MAQEWRAKRRRRPEMGPTLLADLGDQDLGQGLAVPVRPAIMFFRLHFVNDDLRSAGKGWVDQEPSPWRIG